MTLWEIYYKIFCLELHAHLEPNCGELVTRMVPFRILRSIHQTTCSTKLYTAELMTLWEIHLKSSCLELLAQLEASFAPANQSGLLKRT